MFNIYLKSEEGQKNQNNKDKNTSLNNSLKKVINLILLVQPA